ncbi:RES domain-containing protein [Nisaea sp.]|uniref:RES family NAD+ phosphorylase n=1 Tax=Nisaea sp. TaxID=2024842 RepID=UPI0032968F48
MTRPRFSNDRFKGLLFRALNPVYAREPLSGYGAAIHGGRFNKRGVEALYTSLRLETAIREANQVGTLQPTTLVAYKADIGPFFDTRDDVALARYAMSAEDLADDAWRTKMYAGETVPTHELAWQLLEDGYAGLLVQSFVPGATVGELNLVLWQWNKPPFRTLGVIDDEGRLMR